uniref:Uncharacterized protein n=1 Tax=Arundo donax TaxID=35708 RepID=A0A0A8ZLQ1_ARUDO
MRCCILCLIVGFGFFNYQGLRLNLNQILKILRAIPWSEQV